MTAAPAGSRRARTSHAIISAFNALVFEGRSPHEIRVADIVQRAAVGRSTFYEHFDSATDVHLQAFSRPLSLLARALVGTASAAELAPLMAHFWTHRSRARHSFGGKGRERITLLALRLMKNMPEAAGLDACCRIALADAGLGLVIAWIRGDIDADAGQMAREICDTSRRIREKPIG